MPHPLRNFSAIQGGDGIKKRLKNVLKLCQIFREEEDGIFNFLFGKGMDLFWNDHCRCSALKKILTQMGYCYIYTVQLPV